jgi:hypothetical protein
MSKALFEIVADMEALDALLDETGGDVSDPKVEAAITAWLDETQGDFSEKVDSYCGLIRTMQGRAAVRKEESERLMKRVKADENAAKRLADRLKLALELRQDRKLETRRYTVSIVANGGAVPVEIDPGVSVPREFCRVVPETVEPDKKALAEALAGGAKIEGVRLGERGTRLAIR